LFGWESSTDISHKRTNSQESIERKRCRFDWTFDSDEPA
jgi:hypothetical protein